MLAVKCLIQEIIIWIFFIIKVKQLLHIIVFLGVWKCYYHHYCVSLDGAVCSWLQVKLNKKLLVWSYQTSESRLFSFILEIQNVVIISNDQLEPADSHNELRKGCKTRSLNHMKIHPTGFQAICLCPNQSASSEEPMAAMGSSPMCRPSVDAVCGARLSFSLFVCVKGTLWNICII